MIAFMSIFRRVFVGVLVSVFVSVLMSIFICKCIHLSDECIQVKLLIE